MWTTLARCVTRLSSAVGLLALVAGIPAGQVRYIGWPLPDRVPTANEVRTALTSRYWLSDTTLIDGLSVLLWLLWLLFVLSVAVELAASVRGVRADRYRLLAPTQGIAAALVAGLTATIVAAAPAAALPLSAPAPAAAVATAPAPHANAVTPATAPATRTAPQTAAPAATRTTLINSPAHKHKVVKGESLWRIADKHLGAGRRWPEIWDLNKGKTWPHVSGHTTLHDPNLIFPGWDLTLPTDAAAPPPNPQPTDPPNTRKPPPRTATTPPPPEKPPPEKPPPQNPPSEKPAPEKPPTTSETPHPAGKAEASANAPGWIQLAGGFIGSSLGLGLLIAAAMVWKRRRHHYKPAPITATDLDDPDLTPPIGALTHIRQALRRHTPELLDNKPEPGPTVRQFNAADVKPQLPPTGPTGTQLAGLDAVPLTGLGLSGPAAWDAARALLTAALTSGSPTDPDAQGHVIVPATTLTTLLGEYAAQLGPMRRLTVAASFADAFTLVEEEIIRRSRIIADHDAPDVPTLRATKPLAEPLPQLLLIAPVPDQSWHHRMATTIRLGKATEIRTVLIGDWPLGTTLTVNADGTTSGGNGQRLAILDTAATCEILTMLREAHGDAEPPTTTPDKPTPPTPADHQTAPAPTTQTADPPTSPPADATPTSPPAAPDTPEASELPEAPDGSETSGSSAAIRTVSVRVLGTPAILGPDGNPVRGLRAKSLELLVYLAVHRKGASLDDIMEAIWGDATLRRAAERLSTCVGNLRGVLRSVAQPVTATDDDADAKDHTHIEPVINTGSHYHLDPALLHVDWWTVLDEYAHVATAHDDTAKLAHLRAAIAAISGGLADGADYEWIDTDREHARRRIIKILAQAAQLLADTDPHQARAHCDNACHLDPLSDELARQAMRAAARVGDADAIRQRLTTLRRHLDDAGIELDPDTEQLATDLLRTLTKP